MVHIGPPEKFQRNINQLDVRSKGSKPSVKHLQSLIGRCFALAHIGLAPHSPDPNYDGWHGPCHLSNICISSVTAADQDLTHKHQSLLQHVLSESCQLSCEHSLLFFRPTPDGSRQVVYAHEHSARCEQATLKSRRVWVGTTDPSSPHCVLDPDGLVVLKVPVVGLHTFHPVYDTS